ncbi:hypothetical protein ACLMJK_002642 [Lecanora helva]
MSFLNSVLSSIGSKGELDVPTPAAAPPIPASKPSSANLSVTTGRIQSHTSPSNDGGSLSNKRKAEDELQGRSAKTTKGGVVDKQVSRPTPPADARSAKAIPPNKLDKPSNSKAKMPYRGTSKAGTPSTTATVPPSSSSTPAVDTTKAPKKGSYAEIMARAKAAQSKPSSVGVISHKPKDKGYKKQLKLQKKALRNKKLGIKDNGRPGSSGSLSSSPAPGSANSKKVSRPVDEGNVEPKRKSMPQPTYKGTMKAGSAAAQKPMSRDRDGYASRQRSNEYAATDDSDLDDAEEDDYDSEGSDDMEAGFSDVEQEESAAAKAARKEDEEEAKLEAKLKSEKEERKRKLEAMARKAKPQRY